MIISNEEIAILAEQILDVKIETSMGILKLFSRNEDEEITAEQLRSILNVIDSVGNKSRNRPSPSYNNTFNNASSRGTTLSSAINPSLRSPSSSSKRQEIGDFMSVSDVSSILKVKDRSVLDRINSGDLKAYKVGKKYLIKKSDLDNYIENHKYEAGKDD